MMVLTDKIALITGAARGIGQAIAVKFAEAGADLALCDLNQDWLAETAEMVQNKGRRAVCLAADVSKAEDVSAMVSEAVRSLGRIDILVNNAGITRDKLLAIMPEEDWDAVLAVNLKSVFLLTKAVGKIMMKQRCGVMVNIASIIGLIGNPGQCNYAASKAGVIAFTKTTARELASRNIRANAVAPGFIQSKMTEVLPEDIRSKMLAAIPAARLGKPEDVANAALFLASDASAYMTGQVLNVCGGMVM